MSSLKFGHIYCPKLGEEQKKKKGLHSNLFIFFAPPQKKKKRSSLEFGPVFLPKSQGRIMVRDVKNFGPKLNATTLTLPGPLSPGPP